MKLAIISDTHDNLANIEKFISWVNKNKIEAIIHCGDIASGDSVEFLAKKFLGIIHLVYGNMDNNYRDDIYLASDNLKNVKLYGDQGTITISNTIINSSSRHSGLDPESRIRLAFCHFPEVAKKLAESENYNLVFYGHTHKPWMETLTNNCQLINPGTLGGVFQKATFAIYDTTNNKLELKILESL